MACTYFYNLPVDLQLQVLSLLSPAELALFAATCRRSLAVCRSSDLWLTVCFRRWGALTSVASWTLPCPELYRTLSLSARLVGFWRHLSHGAVRNPPLLLFQWTPSSLLGSRVSSVSKIPFLRLGSDSFGRPLCLSHTRGRLLLGESSDEACSSSDLVEMDLTFVSDNHFVLREKFDDDDDDLETLYPPSRMVSEFYQNLANRTSPDRSSRRQRRRERGRFDRTLSGPEHYIRIAECFPTRSRPMQGLWKGFGQDMKTGFYLITYFSSGAISCQRLIESSSLVSGSLIHVFTTSDAVSLGIPFPEEEIEKYHGCLHADPEAYGRTRVITKILGISSRFNPAVHYPPSPAPSILDGLDGRLWHYADGTFGFGFLRNRYIFDLRPVGLDGEVL